MLLNILPGSRLNVCEHMAINYLLSRPVMITIHSDNNSPLFSLGCRHINGRKARKVRPTLSASKLVLPSSLFSSTGGNGTRSVGSSHQPDFFHACLRILHAIAQKAAEKIFCLPIIVWREASDTLAPRSQGNGTSHISGVGRCEHKVDN